MAAEIKYAKAMEKLDAIVQRIEDDDIDVDELALKVKEAVELIRVCKDKIDKAEFEVKKVVDDFQQAE